MVSRPNHNYTIKELLDDAVSSIVVGNGYVALHIACITEEETIKLLDHGWYEIERQKWTNKYLDHRKNTT